MRMTQKSIGLGGHPLFIFHQSSGSSHPRFLHSKKQFGISGTKPGVFVPISYFNCQMGTKQPYFVPVGINFLQLIKDYIEVGGLVILSKHLSTLFIPQETALRLQR